MEKLELKHLAPYLPYGLRVILGTTERDLTAVSVDSQYVFVTAYKGSRDKQMAGIESIKPILRPLSDLTKAIEHDGEKFVPIRRMLEENNFDLDKMDEEWINSFAKSMIEVQMSYDDAQMLLGWHFDIFGLIEKGLAVDINALQGK